MKFVPILPQAAAGKAASRQVAVPEAHPVKTRAVKPGIQKAAPGEVRPLDLDGAKGKILCVLLDHREIVEVIELPAGVLQQLTQWERPAAWRSVLLHHRPP